MSKPRRRKDPAPVPSAVDHDGDLQRIDEALATVESIADAWFEHHRLKPCPPGFLLSLNRLRDFTSFAKAYAAALRVVRE
ncbi:TPA: hypothetical protein QDZ42_001389 [Stenotrophomonas maltophilia]|uniref:hypothetical protein n=1 Tax=Stenotrophomonas TaxID=40323 RepID=UPI0028ABBA92|nr:hypothetical protein [Stenotrophomonas sp.]HDS1038191.1 hypothetical protein [Stenotrophomonas maltophilia]HDS1042749.1 hypothetical protein [Stenotrophomonas maltophilia]